MGFVSTFCYLSGCSPIAYEQLNIDEPSTSDYASLPQGAHVRNALNELFNEENNRAEVIVIGVTDDEGNDIFFDGLTHEEAMNHLDKLRILSRCYAGDSFEFGAVSNPTVRRLNGREETYLVSYGANLMIMSWALPIFVLASSKLDCRRLWALVMNYGHHKPHNHHLLPDIDYGIIESGVEQFLNPFVNWGYSEIQSTDDRLMEIERNSKTEFEAKRSIVHDAGYWVWMAADLFPLTPSRDELSIPSPSIPRRSSPARPQHPFASLPFDIFAHIASFLPLNTLLSLASTNLQIRQTLLDSPSSRSQLLRYWLEIEGRYWLPLEVDLQIPQSKRGLIPRLVDLEPPKVRLLKVERFEGDGDEGQDWWNYVTRCASSGSMRNRKRIWGIVEQIEKLAGEREI